MSWIAVTERLPTEDEGTVAVVLDDGAILTAWATYWHGASNKFANWTFPHGEDEGSTVTHWTPLPPLPACGVKGLEAPSLTWCEHCGEGVTDFCRGKTRLCPKGLLVLHRNAGVAPSDGEKTDA